ncbi:hypothetical protein IFR05_017252, partial [Cadophora sp. M221]
MNTPTRARLRDWLLQSPSHRHIAPKHIPSLVPEFSAYGEEATRTGLKLVGYSRRIAKRKGFSDDPEVYRERLEFAEEAKHWSLERVLQQIFSDEVWAFGGAHTQSYIPCTK